MATSVSQPAFFHLQQFTSAGALMASGRLYFYTTGTTTKKDVYTEATGTTVHTLTSDGAGGEYLALDARGEAPAPIYMTSGAYDVCLKTSAGATVWTRRADPVGADLAASAGSAAIGFLQAGTGAESRTVQSKLRERVHLADFGTLGAGNDAAIFQEAIDAVQGGKGEIILPSSGTVALVATGLNITGSIRILSESGRGRCTVSWTDTTMFAFTVACAGEAHFEGITFSGPSGGTAGGAISLSGTGGVANSRSSVKDCTFLYGHKAFYAPDAYLWTIKDCVFSASIIYGIYVGCTTDVDAGDSVIDNVTMANLGASCTGVHQVSSGGLRLKNSKINGGAYGYVMELAAGANTSILIIEGNSIENQTSAGIRLLNTAGTGTFTHIMIHNNNVTNSPQPILLDENDACFSLATITDNSVSGTAAGSTALITLGNIPRSIVTDNNCYGQGTATVGITIGASCTNFMLGKNLVTGCTTAIADATSGDVTASSGVLTLLAGRETMQLTAAGGAVTSIAAGQVYLGRVAELKATGNVTFTHGNNIVLAGAANYSMTANDTLRLRCFDGVNMVEVGRSVN